MSRLRAIAPVLALVLAFSAACSKREPPEPWEAVEIPSDAEFSGMWFSDSLNGWISGGGYLIDGGIVGRTRDGGRTWRFQSGVYPGGGTRFSLMGVQFRDSLRGCAASGGGMVLITVDGGESWRPVSYGRSPGISLSDIQFIDDWNGWAIGSSCIVRTEDGGESWRVLLYGTAENGYLSGNAIHFVDERRGWLAGHSARFMRSDDGGKNWTPITLPLEPDEHPTLWDVTFIGPNHGWVVGERGTIFHTSDGGWTWTRQDSGVPIVRVIPKGEPPRPREPIPDLQTDPDRLTLTAVQFLDENEGCAVGYYSDVGESVVIRTHDGGESWNVERVQPGEYLRALFVLDATHAWAAGDRSRTAPQVVLRYRGEAR